MVKDEEKLTLDELYNNLEFKLAKKLVKLEYPWVKDLIVYMPENINKYSLIFVEPVIDAEELASEYDFDLASFIKYYIRTDGKFFSPYLSTMFANANNSTDISIDISNKIERIFRNIHNNPAIPDTMRLPKDRRLALGGVIHQPPTDNTTIPN
jgi:hypothetical protein